MAAVSRIDVRVKTGNRDGAGTDGRVYLGLGGREFQLDIPGTNDMERNMDQTFILGASTNVANPANNNPTTPYPLTTEVIGKHPKYLRFEPESSDDVWDLEEVKVTVNPGTAQVTYSGLAGTPHLWLGEKSGKFFYFGA